MTSTADDYLKQHRYMEAAKLFEDDALSTNDVESVIFYYKKAAAAYDELGSYDDEVRCLMATCALLEGEERAECLVLCWGTYIKAIAAYQYETSFEWKGEIENLDPSYKETIEKYYSQAVNILKKAFTLQDVNLNRLLDKLRSECITRNNEGGWATSECASSIDDARKQLKLENKT